VNEGYAPSTGSRQGWFYWGLPDGYTGSVLAAGDVSATVWWKCDEARPARLGDPTPLLEPMATAVFDMASYQPGVFSVG